MKLLCSVSYYIIHISSCTYVKFKRFNMYFDTILGYWSQHKTRVWLMIFWFKSKKRERKITLFPTIILNSRLISIMSWQIIAKITYKIKSQRRRCLLTLNLCQSWINPAPQCLAKWASMMIIEDSMACCTWPAVPWGNIHVSDW